MAIITISRELAALGDETAQETAKRLGFRLVDRAMLEERIRAAGLQSHVLEKYDEKKPGLLSSLSQDRDDYLHFLKLAMLEEASCNKSGCVFIGRGAFSVFGALPSVVPVFLVSSKEIRVERVKSYFHCDEKKARSIIEQSDRDRAGFHRCFFDTEWQNPENYRLALNTSGLHPSDCACIIENIVKTAVSADTDAALSSELRSALLAQQVAHHILYEKRTKVHFLEVGSDAAGCVTLFGLSNSKQIVDAAALDAAEVNGVKKVIVSIQMVEDYPMLLGKQ